MPCIYGTHTYKHIPKYIKKVLVSLIKYDDMQYGHTLIA